ncbi:HTH-type transcriptional regulator YhaJ [Paraburkholderia sediminicola]|uniref:HTH-type transcriptional regulator YhaJ n=1 Tax=Paraburkholderia sediminicola TaxID=458836 RepID=A0A6J5BHS9_9BURK|nr:LysR family transcriptional regulator [Paraburkholderia sediminicola]CAB3707082.1 HTH-type transcriptional regulator YhaJ [Paraburkholderia sediminicola]
MIESVSIDQLRMFVAAADTGSFSAAARRLNRAQSAISQAIAALETSLGISLFDRSERFPKLTPQGSKLLATARGIVRDTDGLKAHARNLAGGLEPELAIVLDTMFPQSLLTTIAQGWAAEFPETPLRVHFEALGAVAQAVLDRRSSIGVIGTLQTVPPDLSREWVFDLPLVTVVAPSHPLADAKGRIKPELAERHVQIVLTDRSALSAGQEFGVFGRQAWRVTELSTKHAFLCAGLGWGNMPYPSVADDIAAGRLVTIELEGIPSGYGLPMSVVYRSDSPPGLAGRWMIDQMRSIVLKHRGRSSSRKH